MMKSDAVKIVNIVLNGSVVIGLGQDGIVYTWVPAISKWKVFGAEAVQAEIMIPEGARIVSITLSGNMIVGLGDNDIIHTWVPASTKWKIYGVSTELKEKFVTEQLYNS